MVADTHLVEKAEKHSSPIWFTYIVSVAASWVAELGNSLKKHNIS